LEVLIVDILLPWLLGVDGASAGDGV
jgi:hypothetical protein